MGTQVSFPALHLYFTIRREAFTIGNFAVYWYGIIIAAGMLIALVYGLKNAKRFNVSADNLSDVVIFGIIFGIIGARLYYVLFFREPDGSNPYFANPSLMISIRDGGLGFYGGVIGALISSIVVCKKKKISTGAVFDIAGLGLLIGQGIGRWGNFINCEAYGSTTNLPWGMLIGNMDKPVHPCFLYEFLWCLLGFIILHNYSKHRKFNGEIFLMYVAWNTCGRFFIEGLRSDSLMIGNIKVSQLVAVVAFSAAIAVIVYKRKKVAVARNAAVAGYDPLFADASKAVEEDVAKYEDTEKSSDNAGKDDNDLLNEYESAKEKSHDEDVKTDAENDGEKQDASDSKDEK